MDAISGMGDEKTLVTEKIRIWHEAGNSIGIPRTATQGIIVPTEHLNKHLERKGYKQLNELMGAMESLCEQYNLLFHDTDNFMEEISRKSGYVTRRHLGHNGGVCEVKLYPFHAVRLLLTRHLRQVGPTSSQVWRSRMEVHLQRCFHGFQL
jgi:hypothetical protein